MREHFKYWGTDFSCYQANFIRYCEANTLLESGLWINSGRCEELQAVIRGIPAVLGLEFPEDALKEFDASFASRFDDRARSAYVYMTTFSPMSGGDSPAGAGMGAPAPAPAPAVVLEVRVVPVVGVVPVAPAPSSFCCPWRRAASATIVPDLSSASAQVFEPVSPKG